MNTLLCINTRLCSNTLYMFQAVPLLQFVFVFASVGSYVAFVLSLLVPNTSFFWCLGRAVLCYCGISGVSSLISFIKLSPKKMIEDWYQSYKFWLVLSCVRYLWLARTFKCNYQKKIFVKFIVTILVDSSVITNVLFYFVVICYYFLFHPVLRRDCTS